MDLHHNFFSNYENCEDILGVTYSGKNCIKYQPDSIQSHQIEQIKEQNILKVPISLYYKSKLSNCLFNVKPPIYKP